VVPKDYVPSRPFALRSGHISCFIIRGNARSVKHALKAGHEAGAQKGISRKHNLTQAMLAEELEVRGRR
jgi:hypothetical protein